MLLTICCPVSFVFLQKHSLSIRLNYGLYEYFFFCLYLISIHSISLNLSASANRELGTLRDIAGNFQVHTMVI